MSFGSVSASMRTPSRRACRLVLGGVAIDFPSGLAGHSDGDVIAHALTDAVLGAAGLGDIGSLFPAGDAALARGGLARTCSATPTPTCARRASSSSMPTAS